MVRHRGVRRGLVAFGACLAAGIGSIAIQQAFAVSASPAPPATWHTMKCTEATWLGRPAENPSGTRGASPWASCILGAALVCAAAVRGWTGRVMAGNAGSVVLRAMAAPAVINFSAAPIPHKLAELYDFRAEEVNWEVPRAIASVPAVHQATAIQTLQASESCLAGSQSRSSARAKQGRSYHRQERRRIGARLARRAMTEPRYVSYDPSRVPTKIQVNLQIGQQTGSQRGQQGKFVPSSRGPARLGDAGLHAFTNNSMDQPSRLVL